MGSPLCQECIPQGLGMAWPWGITVAWESFQKELPVGKNSQSCYTDCWESIASELNCQNLLTQSLSLFSCSFRLSNFEKLSRESALKSQFFQAGHSASLFNQNISSHKEQDHSGPGCPALPCTAQAGQEEALGCTNVPLCHLQGMVLLS